MYFSNIFTKRRPVIENTNETFYLRKETDDIDVSTFLLETLISLEQDYFNITKNHMMATHIAMKDDNTEILQEGLSDFKKSAVEFFNNLLKKVKEFFAKVIMFIRAYLGKFEKFIKTYRDKLLTMNPDFKIEGYNYSFSSDIPRLDKIQQIVDSYNSEIKEVEKMSKSEILKRRNEFTSSDNMDKIRAYVIGSNTPISSEEFLSECKKAFRSGATEKESIHVTKQMIHEIVDGGYKSMKKLADDCLKEKDKTVLIIERMKDFFNRGAYVHYKGDTRMIHARTISIEDKQVKTGEAEHIPYSTQKIDVINTYYNYKWIETKELGSICVTAISEKLNAVKECIKQNEMIIRKLLTNNKEESGDE